MADTHSGFDRAFLAGALEHAHHPTLAIILVHLTGETKYIRDERFKPAYQPLGGDPNGDLSDEAKAELRAAVVDAMEKHEATGKLPPAPDDKTLREMMDYCATEPIPDEYLGFVSLELPLEDNGGEDKRVPGYGIEFGEKTRANYKMLIIGAGMSGLLMGITLKRQGVDFEIIEKNPDVGGTWYDNTYPGCRVDGPNHLYSYSFEAEHHWPLYFSTQPLLLDYFQGVAKKYGLYEHIRFNTEVKGAKWDEDSLRWHVDIESSEGSETLIGNGLVSAVGQLNQPSYPTIDGIGDFDGPAFHSARWDHSVDLKGKRVGVIGTGCSAVQFIPEIAKEAAHVSVFQRTAGWLAPTPEYHEEVPDEKNWILSNLPFYQVWFRFFLFLTMADGPLAFITIDPEWNDTDYAPNEAAADLRRQIEKYIAEKSEGDEALRDATTPKFHLSGKRSIRDNGIWHETLRAEHVDLNTTPIKRITQSGIETEDGTEHAFDVLIYGTGFKANDFLTPMSVIGRDNKDLRQVWDGDARAYLGITYPGFPNFYMMYGPNTNIVVNASIIFFSECEAHFIAGSLKMLEDAEAPAFDTKLDVFTEYNDRVDAANAVMPWGYSGASTWYINSHGRTAQNWPFRLIDYWNQTRVPNPGDFEFIKT